MIGDLAVDGVSGNLKTVQPTGQSLAAGKVPGLNGGGETKDGATIVPLNRQQKELIETMWRDDPALRAAVTRMMDVARNATVRVGLPQLEYEAVQQFLEDKKLGSEKGKRAMKDTGASKQAFLRPKTGKRRGMKKGYGSRLNTIRDLILNDDGVGKLQVDPKHQLFVKDHFEPLIPEALRQLVLFGMVAYRIEKLPKDRVSVRIIPEDFVDFSLEIQSKTGAWRVVVMDSITHDVDTQTHVFVQDRPTRHGMFTSAASVLVNEYVRHVAREGGDMHRERLHTQDIVHLQHVAGTSDLPPQQAQYYADSNLLARDTNTKYTMADTSAAMTLAHDQHETKRAKAGNVTLPHKAYLAPGFVPSPPFLPPFRGDLIQLREHRLSLVFAAMGVPRAVAMADGPGLGNGGGSGSPGFETFKATMRSNRHILSEFLYDVYEEMHGNFESPLEIEVEMAGLMDVQSIVEAGRMGFVSERDLASLFLSVSEIPEKFNFLLRDEKTAAAADARRREFHENGEAEGASNLLDVEQQEAGISATKIPPVTKSAVSEGAEAASKPKKKKKRKAAEDN